MSSTIFFFLFIPLLAFILLAINLIFAPHNPYTEKNSAFECGFSSFLGQNRTQFNISFFIYGLAFLIFDLEILLVYPYLVSAYTNEIYGLTILLLFLLALTLGFAFELGKKALSIDSRQTSISTDRPSYVNKIDNNISSPLNKNLRFFSTNKSSANNITIRNIRFLIACIKNIVFIFKSPYIFICNNFYSYIINIICYKFVSSSWYTYYKDMYARNGLFALLSAFVDFIYNDTINLKICNMLNLLVFHVICLYGMLYINYYLYMTILLLSTIILIFFFIITLLKHIFVIKKKAHPLLYLVCILLCLILLVIFIFIFFSYLFIVIIWPKVKDLLVLAVDGNSGGNNSTEGGPGNNSGSDPGSGKGPDPGSNPSSLHPTSTNGDDSDTDYPNSDVDAQGDIDRMQEDLTWPRWDPNVETFHEYRERVYREERSYRMELLRRTGHVTSKKQANAKKMARHLEIRTDQMIIDDAHSAELRSQGKLPPKDK